MLRQILLVELHSSAQHLQAMRPYLEGVQLTWKIIQQRIAPVLISAFCILALHDQQQ